MGWFTVIKEVLGLGGSLLGGWAELKKIEARSKVEVARIRVQNQEHRATLEMEGDLVIDAQNARNAHNSWKDEWWTVVLSIPLIMCFIPACRQYVYDGFEALATTPEWYQILLFVAVSSAFAMRKIVQPLIDRMRKK